MSDSLWQQELYDDSINNDEGLKWESDDKLFAAEEIKNKELEDLVKQWQSDEGDDLRLSPISKAPVSKATQNNLPINWRKPSRQDYIKHLKDIAKAQWDIMSMLKEVEQKSKEYYNCSLLDLDQQQEALANLKTLLDMYSTPLSDEAWSTLK